MFSWINHGSVVWMDSGLKMREMDFAMVFWFEHARLLYEYKQQTP